MTTTTDAQAQWKHNGTVTLQYVHAGIWSSRVVLFDPGAVVCRVQQETLFRAPPHAIAQAFAAAAGLRSLGMSDSLAFLSALTAIGTEGLA